MPKKVIAPILIALGMSTAIILISSGMSMIVIFIPGILITLAFYFLTVFRHMPQHELILPLYLAGLAIQCVHFFEEYVTGLNHHLPALFNSPEYPLNFFVGFNMFAYAIFILGAIIIYKRIQHLMFIPLFFILFGTIGNAILHPAIATMVGDYFPGLYTSFLFWLVGPLMIKQIWKETRLGIQDSNS